MKKVKLFLAALILTLVTLSSINKAEAEICFYSWSTVCPPSWGECCYGAEYNCLVIDCFEE